jgi:hypothetical protein
MDELEDWLSAAVLRGKQIQLLTGVADATAEHARWVRELLLRFDGMQKSREAARSGSGNGGNGRTAGEEPTHPGGSDARVGLSTAASAIGSSNTDQPVLLERLFVAGDDVRGNTACAFVPPDFALGRMATSARGVLATVLRPAMHAAMATEGWPPPLLPSGRGGRTRARAYSAASVERVGAVVASEHDGEGGGGAVNGAPRVALPISTRHTCADCRGIFDRIWVERGVCAVCTDVRRRSAVGRARYVARSTVQHTLPLPPPLLFFSLVLPLGDQTAHVAFSNTHTHTHTRPCSLARSSIAVPASSHTCSSLTRIIVGSHTRSLARSDAFTTASSQCRRGARTRHDALCATHRTRASLGVDSPVVTEKRCTQQPAR